MPDTVEVDVRGIVQGVGFRPFVYRLAARFSLRGTIGNTATGVVIRVAGEADRIEAFVRAVEQEAPPLAVITSLTSRPSEQPVTAADFVILASTAGERSITLISPDITVCDDCLAEIANPADRRFNYPFTNCTNCGPRFTIISALPYDRPQTSMAVFPMCEECRREYEDPLDRRFHAQPNACPVCGPSLSLQDATGRVRDEGCLIHAARALQSGKILALKGLGGFHLCVDARSKTAVDRLRRRKHRYAKPLAVMVADIPLARQYGHITKDEEALLLSRQRPIVLVRKRAESGLAEEVAPGINEVGIMLPYTPLHALLLAQKAAPEALVMTSGNLSEEPICTVNDDALERLAGIADLFLLHNRDIVTRVDDSVARMTNGRLQMIRRSRGYAPMPVLLPHSLPELLACGAELKNTFCLTREDRAFPGQHIGELTGPKNFVFYRESIAHFQQVFEIEPSVVVCDLHPDYLSTGYAKRYADEHDLPLVRVQHHHAHAAAVMAEHGLDDVLAVVFDGAGLGSDGTVWGGEFLRVDRTGFNRLGHLEPFGLPGGDAAAREPWRVAVSLLHQLDPGTVSDGLPHALQLDPERLSLLLQMLDRDINCPLTSSCGRLFDGVAALLGLRMVSDYEGQAAMELEGLAWLAVNDPVFPGTGGNNKTYGVNLVEQGGVVRVDLASMIKQLLADLSSGVARESIALSFHCWLADTVQQVIRRASVSTGLATVVLSGGCMQNRLLLAMVRNQLEADDFGVYSGEKIPVNDGGIALGQAFIGGSQYNVSGNSHAGT